MVREKTGNLLTMAEKGEFDVIGHGCNCSCTMGSGIALSIKNKYPQAYDADLKTVPGDVTKLGTITHTDENVSPIIVNCYTQHLYGRGVTVYADYDAIKNALTALKDKFPGKRIGLPQIGAGRANGDWNVIKKIIEDVFSDPSDDVTIVIFDGPDPGLNSKSSQNQGQYNAGAALLNRIQSQSQIQNTSASNPPLASMSNSVSVKKNHKPHGKRFCKKCQTKKPVSQMINYLPALWICKGTCSEEFAKIVSSLTPPSNQTINTVQTQAALSPVTAD